MDADRAHPTDELAALIDGELGLEEARAVTGHLRHCEMCKVELVELTAGASMARHAASIEASVAPAEPMVLPPLVLPGTTGVAAVAETPQPAGHAAAAGAALAPVIELRPRRRPPVVLVAAAVVVALITVALVVRGTSAHQPAPLHAALVPVGPLSSAGGTVSMAGGGTTKTMVVDASLPAAAVRTYYAVWLLDVHTNAMVAVGVLPASGTARFSLPAALVASHDAVDISVQPDNGSTVHSSESVLRARYSVRA